MTVSDPEASVIRRVVTGLDGSNKAKVIFDSSLSLASVHTASSQRISG